MLLCLILSIKDQPSLRSALGTDVSADDMAFVDLGISATAILKVNVRQAVDDAVSFLQPQLKRKNWHYVDGSAK